MSGLPEVTRETVRQEEGGGEVGGDPLEVLADEPVVTVPQMPTRRAIVGWVGWRTRMPLEALT